MDPTYTLDITNLVGPLQEIAGLANQLLSWTFCLIPFFIGLLVTFLSINNIFIWVHVIVGFATNSNIKAMIIISCSLYIYNFQYSYQHAISYACNTYTHAFQA